METQRLTIVALGWQLLRLQLLEEVLEVFIIVAVSNLIENIQLEDTV